MDRRTGPSRSTIAPARRLRRTVERMVRGNAALRGAYYRAAGIYRRVRRAGALAAENPDGGVSPENIVWILCTARSGSTWLRSMLQDLLSPGAEVWEEPKVGVLFGGFYDRAHRAQRASAEFVMGDPTKAAWTAAVRRFVLEVMRASHPRVGPDGYLIVKEPGGAVGAPILSAAFPESRMVMLVRDPRDFVASAMDSQSEGSWMREGQDEDKRRPGMDSRRGSVRAVGSLARVWLKQVSAGEKAIDAHRGPKALIRYEDLRADPVETMNLLARDLGLRVESDRVRRVAERHSWDNVPADEKGTGKFYRKATPGGWREDLAPARARQVERITSPLIGRFYP